ncbi:MAG TPA: DsbA family protein [Alphaproteobacteria bacterium]
MAAAGTLGALYAAQPARAADEVFTPAQKEAMGAFISEYLVSHPEAVVNALEAYQANRAAIEQKQFTKSFEQHKETLAEGNAPSAGNPKGDVTVVEFFDYNCGYCKKAVEDVVKLLESDKNLKVIFKEMPILSPASQDAARWALAAHKQGKYYEYHVALMKDPNQKNAAEFESLAKKLGLDVDKMRKDADSKEVRETIEKNLNMARDLGIRGTPGFIIGDTLAPGYMGYDAMKAAIAQVRAAKK